VAQKTNSNIDMVDISTDYQYQYSCLVCTCVYVCVCLHVCMYCEDGAATVRRRVGSIADYDPVNEIYGSLAQGYQPTSRGSVADHSQNYEWQETFRHSHPASHACQCHNVYLFVLITVSRTIVIYAVIAKTQLFCDAQIYLYNVNK